ncbi:MAG: phage portal protein [Bryobacterales bacterium]|nr:phage portal protein [Bryobacterales bacterium]
MGYWRNLVRAAFAPVFGAAAGYEAAAATRRTQGWNPSAEGINALVTGGGDALRSRSRDMVRRNAWACNAVESFVGNAVGTGIKPQAKHPDAAVKRALQELWLRWTDEADAAGLTDFYGLQALICRSTIEGGECLVRIRPRLPEDGLSVPLQLQLLEAEHLPTTKNENLPNGNIIRAGIEFDKIGRRVAYHLYREHPGERLMFANAGETIRVPADSVLHIYKPLRPGQHRGQPWLTQVLVKLRELDQYDDAELVRKKLAAMFAAFITENNPEDPVIGSKPGEGETDTSGVPLAGSEPGARVKLLPGADVKCTEPGDVGGMYTEFMRVQLRAVAAGLGITYEQLTGDLERVNYSSIRAGLLEFRRRCEQFQHQVMVFQFCRPVRGAWIEAAAVAGAIDARDYARNRDAYLDVEWRPPSWDWVDPLKDMNAEVAAVRAGFKPRSAVINEMGYDEEDVDRQVAADNARSDSLGLTLDSDPRRTTSNGQRVVEPAPATETQ